MPSKTEKRWAIVVRGCFEKDNPFRLWGCYLFYTRHEAIKFWNKFWSFRKQWTSYRRNDIVKAVRATVTTEWETPGGGS